jgi:hypothetical protein
MTTRSIIPALVAVPPLPGGRILPGLFLILTLFSLAFLAQDAKNDWGEAWRCVSETGKP